MSEVMEELQEMERERHERLAETMPDVYVCPGVYYHTHGLGQLDERVHVNPNAPDNDLVIILDADYVKMASLDEIIGTIVHEIIHNVLEWEHGYIASHQYEWVSDWVEFWTPQDRDEWHEKLLGGHFYSLDSFGFPLPTHQYIRLIHPLSSPLIRSLLPLLLLS